ncbi:MerR family transcriptional regulator [Millisia brevis]|uniref:MerR family transcriptional regulator n=1 Tax=Millisia brevis TaxID=264148 RepID=UPI00082F5F89|nr:MerR family transcriptional regulator [Millisia brevis]
MLETEYSVGQVASLAGVTVRALHHYEHIGLLVPRGRSAAGYRMYSGGDIDRLRLILYYRELGFTLPDIGSILDDPAADTVVHLRRQRDLLERKAKRARELLDAVERELEAHAMGNSLTPEEKLEIFGSEYDPNWEIEARQRWGETGAWRQSAERSATLGADDYRRIKAETDALNADLAAAKRRGVDPASDEAAALAERHRASIEQFYDCSYAQQRCLADMYLADERFTRTYDDLETGLAQWVHDAIHANADRHGAPPASEAVWG